MAKILLVDSELSDREQTEKFLTMQGHDVTETHSTKTGMNLLVKNPSAFDLAVIDSTYVSLKESCFDFLHNRKSGDIPNIHIVVFCDETSSLPTTIDNEKEFKKRIMEEHGVFVSKKNDGLEVLAEKVERLTTNVYPLRA